jgi:hypothetical protein
MDLGLPFLSPIPGEGPCQEIDDQLDQRRESFETAAPQLPQDEEFS